MAAKQGDYRGEGNSFTSSVAFVRLESAFWGEDVWTQSSLAVCADTQSSPSSLNAIENIIEIYILRLNIKSIENIIEIWQIPNVCHLLSDLIKKN